MINILKENLIELTTEEIEEVFYENDMSQEVHDMLLSRYRQAI